MGMNCMKSTRLIVGNIILFPMSSGASERCEQMNERGEARERSKQYRASECVSGASERASGRTNGPVLYASISYGFNPLCNASETKVRMKTSFRLNWTFFVDPKVGR